MVRVLSVCFLLAGFAFVLRAVPGAIVCVQIQEPGGVVGRGCGSLKRGERWRALKRCATCATSKVCVDPSQDVSRAIDRKTSEHWILFGV